MSCHCSAWLTVDTVANDFVVAWETSITHLCIHGIHIIVFIVPGLSSSPLNAQDNSNTSCNTNGENIRIYVNLTHSVNETECFVRQLT